ncbi:hypothetical protein [Streptomyces rubradiris]|uniref:Uncharacterized protein n=1 Tax=Streptomyces rubradiris TaxID=285531 RepID=A0ABQ3R4H7_STRRR|nr:hypothetical protein [Streptomyces rubradiris]GHH06062.1 hypothetical protein GCM10018792_25120 [Streptomyces rubradiris]GHI50760.1 hypothetical protein Srubr_06060 [Streptomyces rubradiris]
MGRTFENLYGSRQAIRRNALIVALASLVAYALSVLLWAKGGLGAAYPLLIVVVVADAVCLLVYLSFRNKRPGGKGEVS